MTEYNFVPDYAEWWKRKNLTKEELVWLILGVSPDDVERYEELGKKSIKTHEEHNWYWNFYNYYDRRYPINKIGEYASRYRRILEQTEIKKCFQVIYDYHLVLDEECIQFAIQNKILRLNPALEKYKNHSQFLCDFDVLDCLKIKTEYQALGVLLGFEPNVFERFQKLYSKVSSDIKQLQYFDLISLTSDERWFYQEFEKCILSRLGVDAAFLSSILTKLMDLKIWSGDFPAYVQRTYVEGFSFDESIYKNLESKEILYPQYTENCWAHNFYRTWIARRPQWDLNTACLLYKGEDPDGGREFWSLGKRQKTEMAGYSLRGPKFVIFLNEDGKWAKEEIDLNSFVKQHIELGHLTPISSDKNGDYKFKPIDIVRFFRDYCPNTYKSIALLQVLALPDNIERDLIHASAPAPVLLPIVKKTLKKSRESELINEIARYVVMMPAGKKVAADVWKKMKANADNIECIQEMTDSKILWRSHRGIDQKMQRGRFSNIISDFNTGRRVA